MGKARGKKGEWDKTIALHKKSLTLFKERSDKRGMARAYNNLGLAYRNIGEYNEALSCYKKAIKLLDFLIQVLFISSEPFVQLKFLLFLNLSNPNKALLRKPDISPGVEISLMIFGFLIFKFVLSSELLNSSCVMNVYGNSKRIHLSQKPFVRS